MILYSSIKKILVTTRMCECIEIIIQNNYYVLSNIKRSISLT